MLNADSMAKSRIGPLASQPAYLFDTNTTSSIPGNMVSLYLHYLTGVRPSKGSSLESALTEPQGNARTKVFVGGFGLTKQKRDFNQYGMVSAREHSNFLD